MLCWAFRRLAAICPGADGGRIQAVRRPCAVVKTIFIAVIAAMTLPAQPVRVERDPLFRDVRIALRLGSDQVLLIGGEIRGPAVDGIVYDRGIEKFPRSTRYARMSPGGLIYLVPPEYISRYEFDPDTKWKAGDRWKLYPGAGPPITVVIQELAIVFYCGGIGGYAAAITGFENPDAANSVAGLRAGEYLSSPGIGLLAVSGIPVMPVWADKELQQTIALGRLMFNHALGILKSDSRMSAEDADPRLQGRVRRMNQAFLAGSKLEPAMRYFRWSPPGRAPLLFVEAAWTGADNLPLFGCSAVIEQGSALTVLSFDQSRAVQIRVSEHFDSSLQEPSAFLNAWKIGNRYFVLTHLSFYEGFAVRLMELVPGKGLVPVGLEYSAGC